MNKIFLIGRLTKDPEIRVTATGKKVSSFSIAVNEGKNAEGQEIVQFFNCSAWEKLAEIIESYVTKGVKVAIVGRLQNRSWDKPDGSKGYATDILVRELEILSGKQETTTKNEHDQEDHTPAESDSVKNLKSTSKKEEESLPEIDVDQLNVQMPF